MFPEEQIVFSNKVQLMGNSLCVYLPQEEAEKLELEKGIEVKIAVDKGKHGLFIAIWNPIQQEKK